MIVVTGGSGFLGQALVRRLLARADRVRVLDLVPPRADGGAPRLEFHAGSITDPRAVAAALGGAHTVVHLAAKVSDFGREVEFLAANVEGTRVVGETARALGIRRFVHMSSVAVFDYRPGHRGTDETQPAGGHEFCYGRTKAQAEAVVRALATPGFEVVIVRPGLFPYGPGDRVASARMLRALERGLPLLVDGGRTVLSTSYVENLVDGLLLCLDHPAAAGETFHLADDGCPTWGELVRAMASALGRPPSLRSVPRWLAAPAAAALEAAWHMLRLRSTPPLTRYRVRTATTDLCFDNAKARRLLGFRPRIGLGEGLAATVAWYRSAIS